MTCEGLWGTGANEVFYEAVGFNELHQETTIAYGNGRSTQYEYYDHTRRLQRMVTGGSSTIQDIRYTYDKASNLLSVTDAAHTGAQSCSLTSIQYDDLYRLTSLYSTAEDRTITYEYDALGNIHKNGEMGTGTYTYSATQPHTVTSANGNSYAYDAVGNMTTRNRSGQPNQTLTYDEQNRLTQVQITGGSTIQFGYSGGGTRLWKKTGGQITGLWIGNLYEEKDGKVLCHVYAGDRLVATFEPESGFACLIQNNPYLAALWHTSGKTLTGLFGSGRAPLTGVGLVLLAGFFVGRASPHGTRRRARTLALPLWRRVMVTSLVGAILITSVPKEAYADSPQYDPVFYYYHPDNLGSSQLMTDRDGNVVQQYGYTPFGKESYKNNTQAFSLSHRYTGQSLDEETGLYYYGARYYDPELARFIQADSTIPDPEFSQAYNRHAYCYNNPLKFTDPTGQFPWMIVAAIAISGGVAAATGANPVQAMVMTAIGIALFAGFSGLIAQMGVVGPVTTAVIAGAATGAAMSAIAGGNPLTGAAIGAGSAWLIRGVFKIDPGLWNHMPAEEAFGEWMATQAVSFGLGCVQGASLESQLYQFGGDATLQLTA